MNKQEFITTLYNRLSGLPQQDIDNSIEFYSEMIDDRIEEGLTEEEAVSEIGCIDDVVSQIMSEIPLTKLVKEKVKPKQSLKAWEIVLLVLSSPIWLSILIAIFAIVFSVYITIWSIIISFYAIALSLAVCGITLLIGILGYIIWGNLALSFCMFGAGLVLIGLSILLFLGTTMLAKGFCILTKKMFIGIKSSLIKRGA